MKFCQRWPPVVLQSLIFAAGLLLYALILINREPFPLRPISLAVRFGFTLAMPLAAVGLYLAYRLPGWAGQLTSLCATQALFGLALAGLWASGQTTSIVISGLLPWSDASDYYTSALRLLEGLPFEPFAAWRPLFPGLLATLLAITGRNLQAALALLVVIAALSTFLLGREIQRSHGPLAAVFVTVLLFLFYRRFVGTTMSENLGYSLGLLGFALLWRSAGQGRLDLVAGVFLISLALNARPGPFLILPALLLWAWWSFCRRQISLAFGLQLVGAIVAGFLAGMMVMRVTGVGQQIPFSNFAYTLYGLAAGGKGWEQIKWDHPEIAAIGGPQHYLTALRLAWEVFRSDPALLLQGAARQYAYFFSNTWFSAYGYVGGENETVTTWARLSLFLLGGAGLLRGLGRKRGRHDTLVLSGVAGVLLSVPFAPPLDAQQMRLYAAAIPLFGLLPALGMLWLLRWLKLDFRLSPAAPQLPSNPVLVFGAALFGLALLGPLAVRLGSQPAPPAEIACRAAEEAAYLRYPAGSSVNIIKEDVLQLDWMPDFHQGRFARQIHGLPDPEVAQEFEQIAAPATILHGLELASGQGLWLSVDPRLLPPAPALLGVCGHWSQNPAGQRYRFFYAGEVRSLPGW